MKTKTFYIAPEVEILQLSVEQPLLTSSFNETDRTETLFRGVEEYL
jgi:hypothetical protein